MINYLIAFLQVQRGSHAHLAVRDEENAKTTMDPHPPLPPKGRVDSSLISGIEDERDLTLILSCVLGFCLLFYALVAHVRRSSSGFGEGVRRVLLVTAHPDDEVMFFGPTVLALRKQVRMGVFFI